MTYGRATSKQELDPEAVRMIAERLGLDVSSEEAKALTTAYLNQLAAMDSIERFDLHDVVPVFKVQAKWDD